MREEIHYFPSLFNQTAFATEICGISYCDGTYFKKRVNSPICVMEYIVKGTGTVIVEGVQYTPNAGDVYILSPGSNHSYYSDKKNPWVKIFINASGVLIPELLAAYSLKDRILFQQTCVERLFRELFELSGSSLTANRKNEQCTLKFHEILMALAAHENRSLQPSEEAAQLKGLIDSRIDYNYSIAELAAEIYRSEDHVIKLFRRCFGQTPYAYSLALKVQTASRLLTETRLPVSVIAEMVGYHDSKYFCNVFKRYFQCPPTVFRKNQK